MISNASGWERHQLFADTVNPPTDRRYSAGPKPTMSIDELLGCGPPQAPVPSCDEDALVPPWPAPAFAATLGLCPYPMVGGGFDCTRQGSRIIRPPIRWPLLQPLQPWRPLRSPEPATMAKAAMPAPSLPIAAAPRAASPSKPERAWRHPEQNYDIPRFRLAPGESLRQTSEFPVLDSPDPRRQAWHYCHAMSHSGVYAGHFEVQALSRADIANDGRQHRLIVYTRGAHIKAGTYQLAMDTHPEGPPGQSRIFLLHDAQSDHFRTLTGYDTTHPSDFLSSRKAHAVESGGAGDCLFYSVARALGFGGHQHRVAKRLRHMATSYLFHHPEEALNGDTLALFVGRLDRH